MASPISANEARVEASGVEDWGFRRQGGRQFNPKRSIVKNPEAKTASEGSCAMIRMMSVLMQEAMECSTIVVQN
jgi:hypothetical protein